MPLNRPSFCKGLWKGPGPTLPHTFPLSPERSRDALAATKARQGSRVWITLTKCHSEPLIRRWERLQSEKKRKKKKKKRKKRKKKKKKKIELLSYEKNIMSSSPFSAFMEGDSASSFRKKIRKSSFKMRLCTFRVPLGSFTVLRWHESSGINIPEMLQTCNSNYCTTCPWINNRAIQLISFNDFSSL